VAAVLHVVKIKQAHVAVVVHGALPRKQIQIYTVRVKCTWLSAMPRIWLFISPASVAVVTATYVELARNN
jgi:hypothetical protein